MKKEQLLWGSMSWLRYTKQVRLGARQIRLQAGLRVLRARSERKTTVLSARVDSLTVSPGH